MIVDPAEVAALERAGRAAFPGFALLRLDETASTQDVVRLAARSGAAAGCTCVAGAQSAGRGRHDRGWTAPPGSALLCSILVRVDHPHLGGVPIAAGLAARAAIAASCGHESRLKWPNDLVSDGRKLAGILCEVEPGAGAPGTAVVIGIGVNLSVPSFPPDVAGVSLHELTGDPPSAAALLTALLPELSDRLDRLARGGVPGLRTEWMSHAAGIGAAVTAASATGTVSGIAEGVDDDGALLLRAGEGLVRVLAGDVHIGLRPPG